MNISTGEAGESYVEPNGRDKVDTWLRPESQFWPHFIQLFSQNHQMGPLFH